MIANSHKRIEYPPLLPSRRRAATAGGREAEARNWRAWLHEEFSSHVKADFAPHQRDLWEWLNALVPGLRPRPKVDIWPRGGAKSSTAELGCVWVGRQLKRRFGLYVSGTQDQADKHLMSVAALFERLGVDRAVNEYGASKGWTRQMLRTAHGFNMLSIGLDKGVRGIKLDELRPDFIILDDVDSRHDTPATVEKKIAIITESILPAGSPDCAVLFIQNRIHNASIASRLADGTAEFLLDRLPVVEEKAINGLEYELRERADGTPYYAITGGEATWEGQSIEICQAQINTWGLTAFLREAQHDVDEPDGGMFSHLEYRRCRADEVPPLARITVWCDPAVTESDDSDCHGIQCDGVADDDNKTIYRLYSWEDRTSPLDVLCRAFVIAIEYGAECVGVETDQGGDTWHSVYNEAWNTLTMDDADLLRLQQEQGIKFDKRIFAHRARLQALKAQGKMIYKPPFRSAKAGQSGMGKVARNALMLADYERGRFVHVIGTHTAIERGLRRFPKAKPFDLVDAGFWSWHYLTGGGFGNSAVGAFG